MSFRSDIMRGSLIKSSRAAPRTRTDLARSRQTVTASAAQFAEIDFRQRARGTASELCTGTKNRMTRTPANTQPAQTLDLEAVAHMLRCSVRHLHNVRQDDPTFPAPRMLGTSPRWTYETIHAWVELPSRTTTAPAGDTAPDEPTPENTATAKRAAARVH
jgi:predicted DNA-binding transcriptional regulator AlpA